MTPPSLKPSSTWALVCLAVLGCLLQTGCVRRRLMVRSNPPGAMVYVDNQPIGTTPCATDFTYYGTREIRLVKAGYETLTVNQPLPSPWYQIPPLDFLSENVVPSKIQDYRTASYDLVPQVMVPTQQLIARGEQLRQSTLQGAVLPTGASTGAAGGTIGPAGATVGPIPVLPPGATLNQPVFTPPTQGQPTLALPTPFLPPGVAPAPTEPLSTAPGRLPSGGQPLEALPPPRP